MMNKLDQAVQLIKAGNKQAALPILKEMIQNEPGNEMAWLWLYSCVDAPEQKRFCLGKALEINPANDQARKALEKLTAPRLSPAIQPPAPISQNGVSPAASTKLAPSKKPNSKRRWLIFGVIGLCLGVFVVSLAFAVNQFYAHFVNPITSENAILSPEAENEKIAIPTIANETAAPEQSKNETLDTTGNNLTTDLSPTQPNSPVKPEQLKVVIIDSYKVALPDKADQSDLEILFALENLSEYAILYREINFEVLAEDNSTLSCKYLSQNSTGIIPAGFRVFYKYVCEVPSTSVGQKLKLSGPIYTLRSGEATPGYDLRTEWISEQYIQQKNVDLSFPFLMAGNYLQEQTQVHSADQSINISGLNFKFSTVPENRIWGAKVTVTNPIPEQPAWIFIRGTWFLSDGLTAPCENSLFLDPESSEIQGLCSFPDEKFQVLSSEEQAMTAFTPKADRFSGSCLFLTNLTTEIGLAPDKKSAIFPLFLLICYP